MNWLHLVCRMCGETIPVLDPWSSCLAYYSGGSFYMDGKNKKKWTHIVYTPKYEYMNTYCLICSVKLTADLLIFIRIPLLATGLSHYRDIVNAVTLCFGVSIWSKANHYAPQKRHVITYPCPGFQPLVSMFSGDIGELNRRQTTANEASMNSLCIYQIVLCICLS